MIPEPEYSTSDYKGAPPAWWARFRDVVYVVLILLTAGVLYGQITTRLQADEVQIAQMQLIINERLATEKEMGGVNSRLDDIGKQLGAIQGQIFEIQQEKNK